MSKRALTLLLEDMIEAGLKIKKYTASYSFDEFIRDEKTVDAVVRNFEIIGEAANRVDNTYKLATSHVNWSRLRGLRNRIVHEYFGVDLGIIWTILEEDLDTLIDDLQILLSKENKSDNP
jgi:uncharacterized protein with HEPN domain